jgi:hypothetical protein
MRVAVIKGSHLKSLAIPSEGSIQYFTGSYAEVREMSK